MAQNEKTRPSPLAARPVWLKTGLPHIRRECTWRRKTIDVAVLSAMTIDYSIAHVSAIIRDDIKLYASDLLRALVQMDLELLINCEKSTELRERWTILPQTARMISIDIFMRDDARLLSRA